MKNKLCPGISAESSLIVEEKHLASAIGSGSVRVFATAMMIGGMEKAAVAAVQPFLDSGETTVGVHVDVSHKAATPVGMKTAFHAELVEISPGGKLLTFKVDAHDEMELIGEGIHKRVIINKDDFENHALAKLLQKKS